MIFLLMLVIIAVITFMSCDKEEEYGTPAITGVRITDPDKADSLFTAGNLGQMVAILGKNLETTREVYFNSELADLNPTLASENAIVVRIPSDFPTEITNQIKVITLGGTATYDFSVNIPAPSLEAIKCEHLETGDTAIISGNYFYSLTNVAFTGGVDGEILSYTPKEIRVTVPDGAQIGPITVNAIAGTGVSSFIFRDTTGMIIEFDHVGLCYGAMPVIDASTNPSPSPVSGNYTRASYDLLPGGTWWDESLVFAYCGSFGLTSGLPEDYIIKFEINVISPWTQGWFEVKVVGDIEYFYRFQPWTETEEASFITTGWKTISIPLGEFREKTGSGNPDGIYLTDVTLLNEMYFAFQNNQGTQILRLDVCFDNVRTASSSDYTQTQTD